MDAEQAKQYVRTWILSGGTNPPEPEFKKSMHMLKNEVLDQLAAFCDKLIENFIHTHGTDAPGIPIARKAKQIILSSK